MGLDAPAGLPHLSSSRGTAAPKTGGRFVIRAHGCGRLVAPAGLIPAARQYFHMAAGKDRHFISCIAARRLCFPGGMGAALLSDGAAQVRDLHAVPMAITPVNRTPVTFGVCSRPAAPCAPLHDVSHAGLFADGRDRPPCPAGGRDSPTSRRRRSVSRRWAAILI